MNGNAASDTLCFVVKINHMAAVTDSVHCQSHLIDSKDWSDELIADSCRQFLLPGPDVLSGVGLTIIQSVFVMSSPW